MSTALEIIRILTTDAYFMLALLAGAGLTLAIVTLLSVLGKGDAAPKANRSFLFPFRHT